MRSTKGKTKMKLITKDELETNCKKYILENMKNILKHRSLKYGFKSALILQEIIIIL